MNKQQSVICTLCLIFCLGQVLISCKGDTKTTTTDQVSTAPPSDGASTTTTRSIGENNLYEVAIDPSSLCYQRNDKGDILQLRYTSDGSRIKGVYNSLTKDQSKMRTGVVTGFISNTTIKSVYSYRVGTNTTRQGLTMELYKDHIVITHPDENGRTEKLPLVDCGSFMR